MSNGTSNDLSHDERLNLEKKKIRWTAIAVGVSIFIPLIAAAAGIWQGSNAIKEQAKYDFQLKAAEIVMDTTNPVGTGNRANALKTLFPKSLEDSFAQGFTPTEFGAINETPAKKELIRLIAEHPSEKQEIIKTWKQLFPNYKWVDDIKD